MTHHFEILRPWVRGGFLLTPLLLLAGCGGSDNAAIRVLNVSQDYTAINVFDGSTSTDPTVADVTSGTLSSYSGISSGSQTLYFTEGGNTQTSSLASETESFTTGEHRTYVTYGDNGEFGEYEIDENQAAPGGSDASVEVLDTASDAGGLDVYFASSASLTGASPNFTGLVAGKATSFTSVASGTYQLIVTGTGNDADVRLQVPSVVLDGGEVVTIVLTESAGGYLVNAYLLPQGGSLTTDLNPNARIRAVVGLTSGSDISATVGSTAVITNASPASVGTYQMVPVGSGTVPVSVTVGGVGVSAPEQALAAGQDYTLLIYQGTDGIEENWLVDINRLPVSGDASLRLVHAMSGLTDPISLAVDSVPAFTDVSQGEASSYDTGIAAGATTTLSVTDTTTSQLLYSQSAATLASQGVYTLFMFGSASSAAGTLSEDR
ncbi:MAG TPA: DUF4397 domain-containing protein [Steroidobacteraceae bacterium]|nr:DUF4397 domain-containing protein [Steroidobacteraceae bacterium]